MRYLLSVVLVALCNLSVQSLPVPGGQIIHYNLPHKLFNKNSSIYDILSQIHYGGSATSSSTSAPNQEVISEVTTISDENETIDVKNDGTTQATLVDMEVTNSDESHEALTTEDVTDEEKNHQPEGDNSVYNNESLTALIEKVVNEQIEKLASETDTEIKGINLPSEQSQVIEKTDLDDESKTTSNTEKTQLDDQNDDDRVIETTMAINSDDKAMDVMEDVKMATEVIPEMLNIESVDLDSESQSTNVPTNQPEITTSMEVISIDTATATVPTTVQDELQEKLSEEATKNKNEIPAPLLNAIGDLLSSVLGIRVNSNDIGVETSASDSSTSSSEEENIQTTTFATVIEDEVDDATTIENNNIMEYSTEQELSSSTSALEFNENNASVEDETSDVQNSESVPQDESVHDDNTNEVDLKIENLANVHDTNFMTENTPEVYTETVKEPSNDEILEALPALTVEEEAVKPTSIQESVNHIMSLVRGTEDKLALENAHHIVDSILIDHKKVNDNVNHILNTALKEIETNFGVSESDREIEIPTDALDTLDREREEMIRNFETDINESLIDSNIDDHESFVPNIAKAALFHNRFQYGDDDF